jgi:hypothetical protein
MAFDFGLIPGAVQGLVGLGQAIVGGIRARRAQKSLGRMIDSYKPSESIMDYYNKALQRYNVNPYTSQLYNQQQNVIRGGTAQGIGALQDRRSALGGVSSLVQGQNDAMLKAAAAAEGQQAQSLAQLGQATSMKDREDKYKFEAKANLLAAKAAGAANQSNAGMANLYGGLGNLSNYYLYRNGDNAAARQAGTGDNYDYITDDELFRYRNKYQRR